MQVETNKFTLVIIKKQQQLNYEKGKLKMNKRIGVKVNKSRTKLFAAILFLGILYLGFGIIVFFLACHGECGASNHGGQLMRICSDFYVPLFVSYIFIIAAAIAIVISTSFLIREIIINSKKDKKTK